jgi:hypothetical protein
MIKRDAAWIALVTVMGACSPTIGPLSPLASVSTEERQRFDHAAALLADAGFSCTDPSWYMKESGIVGNASCYDKAGVSLDLKTGSSDAIDASARSACGVDYQDSVLFYLSGSEFFVFWFASSDAPSGVHVDFGPPLDEEGQQRIVEATRLPALRCS